MIGGRWVDKVFDIIGIENLIMDFALRIDHLPETDGMSELHDYLWQSGGNASSAIVAASRLGAKCAMVGTIGTDEFGRFCLNDMIYHGVDVSHIYQQEGDTALCICLAEEETQGRSFVARRGVNNPLTDEQIDESFIASAKYIHCSVANTEAKRRAIRYAKKHNVIVSYDAGSFNDDAEQIITDSDILIMSHQFYKSMFGENSEYVKNCRKLLQRGPQIVIVTLGAMGCAGTDGKIDFRLPPFSGYTIVDTTGAGDVFHGGFLYAHSKGWNLEECARFASAVSYINCTSLGGRVGIPDRGMVEQFLETGIIEDSQLDERKKHYHSVMYFK